MAGKPGGQKPPAAVSRRLMYRPSKSYIVSGPLVECRERPAWDCPIPANASIFGQSQSETGSYVFFEGLQDNPHIRMGYYALEKSKIYFVFGRTSPDEFSERISFFNH